MVIMTEQAATAIRALTHQPDSPPGAGLRIASDENHLDQLSLNIEPAPVDGDAIVESSGALLFLDENAAAALNDKALDARADDSGNIQFTVHETDH
ncbi:MAG TPA: adhesin [Micromonosporaceae bacterium]